MVKKTDDGSSTDSCDEKDKMEDKAATGCGHVNKSIELSKLRKAMKSGGIHQNCIECEKNPPVTDEANDDGFEYDNTLWLCLRCGLQLCGRRKNKHALRHFEVSLITFLFFIILSRPLLIDLTFSFFRHRIVIVMHWSSIRQHFKSGAMFVMMKLLRTRVKGCLNVFSW
jgi:hypothetical protein